MLKEWQVVSGLGLKLKDSEIYRRAQLVLIVGSSNSSGTFTDPVEALKSHKAAMFTCIE